MQKYLFFIVLNLFLPRHIYCQVWDSLGTFTYGESKHFKEFDNKLYVGGIDTSQGVSTFNMATWDGNVWESVGGGIDGQVFGTARLNGKIFVGGLFNYAGGAYPWPAPHIYHLTSWDGIQYNNLNFPNGNYVHSLCVFNNELYIGTTIVTINNQDYYGILKYNDTTWSDVGGGVNGFPRYVNVMEEYNGELIVGGDFSTAGPTLQVNNIARWNGSNWNSLGNGLDNGARAFEVDTLNNLLYAGGSFNYADSILVNHVAKWDGSSWQNLGIGVPIIVLSICIYKNELYVGGSNFSGLYPSSLYKWNGSSWLPIIPSPSTIECLNVFQGSLYVAGGFTEIGGIRYSGLAKYTDTTLVSEEIISAENVFNIYPNPTNGNITLSLPQQLNGNAEIMIYNSAGELVYRNSFRNWKEIVIANKTFKQGTFVCQIKINNILYSKKFIVN